MAKAINFTMAGKSWQAGLTKLDRDRIYGYIEEVVLDGAGEPCSVANLLDDGRTLVLPGAMAIKTVDPELHEVVRGDLKAVNPDGTDASLIPSSYEVDVPLQEASLDDLFNLEVTTVYQLAIEDQARKAELVNSLGPGKVLRFPFNARAGYEAADAVMISAQQEVFILAGRMIEFPYLENNAVVLPGESGANEGDEEEDVDFGML